MLTREIFQKRRKAFMAQMEPGSIAIIPGASLKVRSHDTHFPFRQASYFDYLTGYREPRAFLVLRPGQEPEEVVLFNLPINKKRAIWDGPRVGQDGAVQEYGVDAAYSINKMDKLIPEWLENCQTIYCPITQFSCNS